MSQTNPPIGPEAAREVRTRTLDLLDRLAALASEYDLPQPPDALEAYRKQLRENRYTVLVAGEAKRGKSTFVNALLGRELLPTDVDIATCQVFRVRQAPDEGFRVRFEDDSVDEITAEDLARFGSQVLADLGEVPRLSQMIRWIEVEGPIHFLPSEITLLDTPGLGSLYAAHARITRRYVPLADAVIFVLSSDSPIGREEIQFLGEIRAVTRRVLFIQTMIDRYSREHWQAIQARNERILAETFGDRLLDHRVWPISSTNLLTAAQTGEVDFEQVSRFRPLASALQAFLFRAAGWNRAAEAVVLATDYHRSGAASLAFRQATLRESAVRRASRQAGTATRKDEFEEAWGKEGQQRRRLLDEVRRTAQIGRQHFQQTVGLNGTISQRHLERIAAVKDLDQARALAGTLTESLVNDAANAWDDVCRKAQARVTASLAAFIDATEVGIVIPRSHDVGGPRVTNQDPEVRADFYSRVQAALREGGWTMATFTGGASLTGAVLIPTLVTATVFLPVVGIGALGAGLFGLIRGLNLASKKQVHEAQRELENHLRTVLQRIQQHYFNVDLDVGSFAIVEEYFKSFVDSVTRFIEEATARRSEEARAELDRLAEESGLDERRRRERGEQLSRQVNTWSQLGAELLRLTEHLDRSMDPQPPPGMSAAEPR